MKTFVVVYAEAKNEHQTVLLKVYCRTHGVDQSVAHAAKLRGYDSYQIIAEKEVTEAPAVMGPEEKPVSVMMLDKPSIRTLLEDGYYLHTNHSLEHFNA